MRKSRALAALTIFGILALAVTAFGDDVTLTLLPSGNLSGPPGSTVGWGYTITNNTANWLETLSLDAGSFTSGTPNLIFDFPTVGPNSSITENFSAVTTASCSSPPCGLYEFTWNSNAPVGTVNSGTFTLSSEYFSGDPANPASTDLGPAPDASANYSISAITVSTVPESASIVFVFTGLCGLCLLRRRQCRAAPISNVSPGVG